jgi:ABC-type Fe3+-hydroxamate transport system substrate-binding protein
MVFIDQMNHQVYLPNTPPKRIISLVPSQTELLHELGLSDEVAGITKFCVHPRRWFREKIRVGGTKKVKLDIIRNIHPDLIIGNKEENTKEDIELLRKHYPVWMSDIRSVEAAFDMIKAIGKITQKENKALECVRNIQKAKETIPQLDEAPSVAYFIWRKPWMVVGRNTYINNFLHSCGFRNAFADKLRYPEVNLSLLSDRNPDYIFLSSEPFPFKDKHLRELQAVTPDSNIELVNGEMFSWYGPRMKQGFDYVSKLIQNQIRSTID